MHDRDDMDERPYATFAAPLPFSAEGPGTEARLRDGFRSTQELPAFSELVNEVVVNRDHLTPDDRREEGESEEEDEEEDEDEMELEKAQNLVFGGRMRRGKDPDFPEEAAGPFQEPVKTVRDTLDGLYSRLEHLDTDYDILEDRFTA